MRILNNNITTIAGCFLAGACICVSFAFADPAASAKDLSGAIQYLLDFVKASECQFYRNNKEHSPEEAVAHMKRKYAHFKDNIKTPEDFIRLTATKSLISGKRYYVIVKDGKKITSEAWLLLALEDYRLHQKKFE